MTGSLRLSVIFLCLLLVPCISLGATYYVDALNGNDGNNGASTETAWKTFQKVNSASLHGGDQVLLKRGSIFRETLAPTWSGSAGNPVTVAAYGTGDPPVVSGANHVTGWSRHNGNIWKATLATRPNILIVNNVKGVGRQSLAEVASERDWYWSSNTVYLYAPSDPAVIYTAPGVEAGARSECISLHYRSYVRIRDIRLTGANEPQGAAVLFNGELGGSGNHEFLGLVIENCAGSAIVMWGSSNNKVDSCIIRHLGGFGVYVYRASQNGDATGNTISNCTIYDAPSPGISIYGYSDGYRASGNVATGNTVYNCGDGIYLTLADSNSVRGNTLYSNRRTEAGGEGYGVGVCSSSSNEIRQNTLYDNRTNGIEVWGGVSPWGRSDWNLIYQNLIHTNSESGILFSSSYSANNQVVYNVVRQNGGSGLLIGHSTSGNTLYNNTVYGNASHGLDFYDNASGWTIRNNLLAGNGQYAMNGFSSTSLQHDHNCYHSTGGTVVTYGGKTYTSATLSTFESTAVGGDPKFVNVASQDLHLASSSPCIDAGVALGFTADNAGSAVPSGTGVDIGAFEQQATTPLLPPRNLHIIVQ